MTPALRPEGKNTNCAIRKGAHQSSEFFHARRCEEKPTADSEAALQSLDPSSISQRGGSDNFRGGVPSLWLQRGTLRHCYSKGHLCVVLQSSVLGVKLLVSFSPSEEFVRYNGPHESSLRELGGQPDFKDFNTSAAEIKMDITNYQSVSERFQSSLPEPLSLNTLSAASAGTGI